MKISKILKKEKLRPIHVLPGDSFSIKYEDKTVMSETITKSAVYTQAVIFEIENNDKKGIGGALLE